MKPEVRVFISNGDTNTGEIEQLMADGFNPLPVNFHIPKNMLVLLRVPEKKIVTPKKV